MSKEKKAKRKRERAKERVVENGHKFPCPICELSNKLLEGICCIHCNHKSIFGS